MRTARSSSRSRGEGLHQAHPWEEAPPAPPWRKHTQPQRKHPPKEALPPQRRHPRRKHPPKEEAPPGGGTPSPCEQNDKQV